MNFQYYLKKVKDVKLIDYISVFPMLLAALISPFFRRKYKDTWAVCERKAEARDNGYHFFKYVSTYRKEQSCIYLIDKNCSDFHKVKDIGNVDQFGSIKHWILYFNCKYLISSQSFKPNGYVCTFIERSGLFKPNHIFLQHGITQNKADFLLASRRSAKYFIAGAKPEYDFIRDYFGYPDRTVQLTGFARFDALHNFQTIKNRILIMPTWRKWLRFKSEEHKDAQGDIVSSEYIAKWKELLNSKNLIELIKKYNLDIIFYPHPNMINIFDPQSFIDPNIHIADVENEDLQELMKTSEMLITDYSSVFFDMAYMLKPVIFFQFDEEKFRKYHYQQGWFDYRKTAFGVVFYNTDDVLNELKKIIARSYTISEEFINEHKQTYTLYDTNNCERIYELLNND